jgi:hypothetical protein
MGFGKAKYDVEEKGLDPTVPHKDIAQDGRLAPQQQQQPSESALKTLEAFSAGVEDAVESLEVLDVPVVGLPEEEDTTVSKVEEEVIKPTSKPKAKTSKKK